MAYNHDNIDLIFCPTLVSIIGMISIQKVVSIKVTIHCHAAHRGVHAHVYLFREGNEDTSSH